jgi:hypothetical protein
MTQLYVPPLRARFVLTEDWTFPLWHESRNSDFASFMKKEWPSHSTAYDSARQCAVDVTIAAGTVMYIDRYYIKNGGSDFDSITFRAIYGKKTQRFWAKLKDTNRIQANFDTE